MVCGAGQSHYSTGAVWRFTVSNFFSRFVGESNTLLPSWHNYVFNYLVITVKSVK
jgi:hypothetical protein